MTRIQTEKMRDFSEPELSIFPCCLSPTSSNEQTVRYNIAGVWKQLIPSTFNVKFGPEVVIRPVAIMQFAVIFACLIVSNYVLGIERLEDCLNYMLDEYSGINSAKILQNFDVALKHPAYKMKGVHRQLFHGTRFDLVIIRGNQSDLQAFARWNHRRQFFNPKASYIVTANNASREIFRLFSTFYMTKVYVIDNSLDVYTYNPYRNESVDNPDTTPIKIGDCSRKFPNVTLFLENSSKFWRNTTLRVCLRILAPYTTAENDGLEDLFMQLVQRTLKFKRKSIILDDTSDHTKSILTIDQHLSIQGMKKLRDQDADVLVGYNSPTAETPKHFDITGAFYYDDIAWAAPNPKEMSYVKRLSHIFSLQFWIFLLTSVLLWIVVVHYVQNATKFFELIFVIFQILLEHSVSKHLIKRRLFLRISLLAWMVAFLVLSTLFKNSILVILGTEKRYPRLTTVQDVLNSNLQITSYVNLSDLYINSENQAEYPFDFEKIEQCESVLGCVNKTAFQRNSVTTAPRIIVWYNWIPKYFITKHGEVLVRVSDDSIVPIHIHLIASKGYPLFPQINDILGRMRASGWFNHVYTQMRLKIKRATNPLVFDAGKIGLSKFNFVFLTWIIGLTVGAASFVAELLWFKQNIILKDK